MSRKRDAKKSQYGGNRRVIICLCLASCCLSTSLNGMSPSLSMIARDLKFNDKERDTYLGGYVGLATMLGQMLGSCFSGLLTDKFSRSRILVYSLILGAAASFTFASPFISLNVILFLRVTLGACQGAGVPVIFSLIGDFYEVNDRASVSAVVSSCLGGGMMVGQLFVGYCLPYLGWRRPFLVLGAASVLAAICLLYYLSDPAKGGNEVELEEMLKRGISLPPLSLKSFFRSLTVPTTLMLVLQTLPNTMPWGVLSAHLHDVLATDAQLSMRAATSLIAIFGAGAAVGGVFGGFLGAYLYSQDRRYLPLFMGTTLAASAFLLQNLLALDFAHPEALRTATPLLVLSGMLAAVNGANIRVVVINLNSPETRGAAVALLNFVNCLGRGCGPAVAEAYMYAMTAAAAAAGGGAISVNTSKHTSEGGLTRRDAMCDLMSLWFVAGALLCAASITISQDEERLRKQLRKYADERISSVAASTPVLLEDGVSIGTTAVVAAAVALVPVGEEETSDLTAGGRERGHEEHG